MVSCVGLPVPVVCRENMLKFNDYILQLSGFSSIEVSPSSGRQLLHLSYKTVELLEFEISNSHLALPT
jgi:hypothetical protein